MKFLKYLTLIVFVAVFVSCEDYFGENANVDPDNPIVATPNVLLPQVQARLAYVYGGDFARYLGINTQHIDGVGRQFAVIGNYGIVGSDCDASWANIYTGSLSSNRKLIDLSVEGGFAHYQAVALIMETYAMMMATDAWGDIPYSNAFGFGENGVYAPTFDTQEAIYTAIFANLDTARGLLAGPDGGNAPGNDDLFYGGDASQWIKFCNVLEARGKLHLSKVNGNAYAEVLAALAGGFDSAADEANAPFGTGATENSPWWQYIEQRDDCEVGASYVALMESLSDPRAPIYGYEHSIPDHPIFTQDQPVKLLSYTEQEFMRAEALLGTGDSAGAYGAYLGAIESSMMEAGLADADYQAYIGQAAIGVGAGSLSMEDIMTQKYIALFTSPEVFNDWRRTGIPNLTPKSGTVVPRRLPYPETEVLSNSNAPTPADITIFDRVWWDQ